MKADKVGRVPAVGQALNRAAAELTRLWPDFEAALLAAPAARWSDSGVDPQLLERIRIFVGAPTEADRAYRASVERASRGGSGVRREPGLIARLLRWPGSVAPAPGAPVVPWLAEDDQGRVAAPPAAPRAPRFPPGAVGPH